METETTTTTSTTSTTTDKTNKKNYQKKSDIRAKRDVPAGVDMWKPTPLKRDEVPKRVLYDESSFSTVFPKYREKYIKEIWPLVEKELVEHGIDCKLDFIEGTMTVVTTKKCWDPVAILKARDLIKLLSRSVPFVHAKKIMEDDNNCDIIKIGGLVRNKERFVKRRQRLIGPDGATLKSIELLTRCYVLIQGTTVASIGPWDGLEKVRKIVEDCMKNIHPIYNIKELMIRRELFKNDALKSEDWSRFIPKFKKRNVQSKAPAPKKKKNRDAPSASTIFTPRKEDLEMESGEYFMSKESKDKKKKVEREKKQEEATIRRQQAQAKHYIAPAEKEFVQNAAAAAAASAKSTTDTLKNIQSNINKNKRKDIDSSSANDFIQGSAVEQPIKKKK
ncbi:hypothetical protein DFA_02513 [Cavenderia fasciculata]|uniref:KRR1 small subunit processome component n=1 Tax=Cavenderia fasciculata TaxID=261658 RepID=F4PZL0_CACFS|nr:uncharacterized protein DFA_02513 [Cavenderia fasciculata]EGG18774.1 hypothetical protein DFA_02513 [Cavenderia fasciculata]|eukprot:XP_004357236.1 hypothetical protein DFA_02513 [Cavenderia fasciculata]